MAKKNLTVLFVAKQGKRTDFKPVVQNQLDALAQECSGINFERFPIPGKGVLSYLKAIVPLRKMVREVKPDVIHAHYSFSGFLASLVAPWTPVVVSLMGSDVEAKSIFRLIIKVFVKYFWSATIVKSESLKQKLNIANVIVLPNGVDINRFKPLDQATCKEHLGWEKNKKQILFLADINRPVKNFALAKAAYELLDDDNVELKAAYNIDTSLVPVYINAAGVVIMTSLWEGSPNTVKEALACNRPVVSTNVGDVALLLKDVQGCFIAENEPVDFAQKIKQALSYSQSNGREKIKKLKMDSQSVSQLLKELYVSKAK